MKANCAAIVALLLWLLFFASNAFAVLKSPYPRQAGLPDQITIISDGGLDSIVGMASKPK